MSKHEDISERAWETFVSLIREFDENSQKLADLEHEIEKCRERDSTLNDRLCVLGELLGIDDLDAARQHIARQGLEKR